MCNLVFQKFNNSEYLRTRLLVVQDKIIEENFWHDNFWGYVNVEGALVVIIC